MVTFFTCAHLNICSIAACTWFGDTNATNFITCNSWFQVVFFQEFTSVMEDVRRAHKYLYGCCNGKSTGKYFRNFFQHDDVVEKIQSAAAETFRIAKSEVTHFTKFFPKLARNFTFEFPLVNMWNGFCFQKLSNRFSERFVFFIEVIR